MSRLILVLFFTLCLVFPSQSFAAEQCSVIYGGGKVTCTTDEPTPTPPSAAKNENPPQTKGGLPVHSPTQVQTTPATGPETLALMSLVPAAGLGFWLKRKTNLWQKT